MITASAGEVGIDEHNPAILQPDEIALAVPGIIRSGRQQNIPVDTGGFCGRCPRLRVDAGKYKKESSE